MPPPMPPMLIAIWPGGLIIPALYCIRSARASQEREHKRVSFESRSCRKSVQRAREAGQSMLLDFIARAVRVLPPIIPGPIIPIPPIIMPWGPN